MKRLTNKLLGRLGLLLLASALMTLAAGCAAPEKGTSENAIGDHTGGEWGSD